MDQSSSLTEIAELRQRVSVLNAENRKLRAELAQSNNSLSALLQSEQLLLTLVYKVPVGIFATDTDGNIVFVNEAWSEIAGIAPEQAVGRGWINALHSADHEEIIEKWKAAGGETHEFSCEHYFRNSEGKSRWVFCRTQANITEEGIIEGYFGTIIDITERKRFEEEISRLNAQLEERVRERTRQLSALSDENDKKFKELSLLYRLSNTMLSTIQLNKLIHLILTALTSGENPFFDRAMLFLLNERAAVMQGMLGVTRETSQGLISATAEVGDILSGRWDLTEEDMVRQRDSEFSSRVRGSRLALDSRGNISSRSVLEKRLFFVPDVNTEKCVDRDFVKNFGVKSFASAPLIAKEQVVGVVIVDNSPSERPISEDDLRFLQLFTNQAGMAIENSMLYNRLEDANRSLRDTQERLIQSERLSTIGEMAAGIAHELKNPLVSIGGFARRLYNKLPQGAAEREYADTIVQEVRRLEKMLTEILAFSKKSTLCYTVCNINEIVEDSLAIVAPTLEESRISVNRNFVEGDYSFLGDCQQLKQVFLNLFWNAQEAMKNGGQIKITISPARLNNRKAVSVKVADSGGGIQSEVLHNIFNPFYTTKESGTGLGLPISNRIVTNHGGKIRVNNHPGEGVEFNVIIPFTD